MIVLAVTMASAEDVGPAVQVDGAQPPVFSSRPNWSSRTSPSRWALVARMGIPGDLRGDNCPGVSDCDHKANGHARD
jgi:hypothetical protein